MRTTALFLLTVLFSVNSILAQEWKSDFKEAKNEARTENKNILLVFSGSDWCAPCIKLEKKIFKSDFFKAYSDTHWVLLRADFPKKRKNALPEKQREHNNALAEMYNKNGYFPLVLVLDPDGTVLRKTGYKNLDPEQYIKSLSTL